MQNSLGMLANKIEQHIKIIKYHNQVEFIPEMQGWFNMHKLINVIHHHINRKKDTNYIIISIDARKHLAKFNTFLEWKFLTNLAYKELTSIQKWLLWKALTNITISDEMLKTFLMWNKTKAIQSRLEVITRLIKQEKW